MDLLSLEEGIIDQRIVKAVQEMGFKQFSPIQEQSIPEILAGKDVIGQAQTGTGKTAAFGIPLLQMIDVEDKGVQGIVLCPTRELAIQAAEELKKFSKYMHGIRVLPIYGGQEIYKQIKALKGGVQIIVGTPGRVMDHMRRHTIKLDSIKTVILDEADEMLNMGFREDMEEILSQIEQEHQTILFSATMPKAILNITGQFQNDPILIKTVKKELTVNAIKQYYYEVRRDDKKEVTARILEYYSPKRTLVFCNTKRMVEELANDLKSRGFYAEGIHGDLTQGARDRVMDSFKKGSATVLIATDVAARGIDVDDVEAVINFDVPQDIEYYIHRIGRTGRAGRSGRSFTLVNGKEIYKIRDIENICKSKMKARTVPTATDIESAKSGKVLKEVIEVMNNKNLAEMTKIIETKMEEEDCTALQLAAAFLKLHMGEEKEDIPVEKYVSSRTKSGRNGGGDRRFGDKRRSGGGDRDRRSGSGEKRYGDKDRDRRYGEKKRSGSSEGRSSEKRYDGKKRSDDSRSFEKRSDDKKKGFNPKFKRKSKEVMTRSGSIKMI